MYSRPMTDLYMDDDANSEDGAVVEPGASTPVDAVFFRQAIDQSREMRTRTSTVLNEQRGPVRGGGATLPRKFREWAKATLGNMSDEQMYRFVAVQGGHTTREIEFLLLALAECEARGIDGVGLELAKGLGDLDEAS